MVQFNDTDSGRTYYLIRELLNNDFDDNGTDDLTDDEFGAFEFGWGLFIYNPGGTRPIVITVPHPCDDYITPAIGYFALQEWNAKFLLINGAGREVKWTNIPPYSNAKSLSDPTRTSNHPFQTTYKKFCDFIRQQSGYRELSIQIHSCDFNRYPGYPDNQITAGYNRFCPNLPIRDLSRWKRDLINQGTHLLIPANTIGTHSSVYINDYYSVQNSVHPFIYDNGVQSYPVNNNVILTAYSQNQQMLYSISGWNDYDIFEPFFHIEMKELPSCYAQTANNLRWFYGWNAFTQRWDFQNIYNRAVQYYSRWITDLNLTLNHLFPMNDNNPPLPPTNLQVFNQSYDYITLRWNKSDDYEFDTYEILYATTPITDSNFQIYSRVNDSFLASPNCEQINVQGLTVGTQYYFKIRAKDKNGNYSPLSNEVTAGTGPAKIYNFRGIGRDNYVEVKWLAQSQQNNQGFKMYRQILDGTYILVDSWQTNPVLNASTSPNQYYTWIDNNVVNNVEYNYKLSATHTNNTEFFHNLTSAAMPKSYHTLRVFKVDSAITDSITFSNNPYASDGNDSDYDVVKASAPGSNYVYAGFWKASWGSNGTLLQREVLGGYDVTNTYKTLSIRIRSDQVNQPLRIEFTGSLGRYTEKLYLYDHTTAVMTNMAAGAYNFTVQNSNNRSFTLYWGNLQPNVSVSSLANSIYKGGNNATFYWSTSFSFLVDHYELSIQSDTDSLLVNQSLPGTQTSYNYTFPLDANFQNARLVVDAWSIDGQRIRKYSDYVFGIVPYIVNVVTNPGMKMRANVWPTANYNIVDVFGQNSAGWTMDTTGQWWQIEPYSFGLGYWILPAQEFPFSSTMAIQSDSISFAIRPGWNIIPNPHLCSYGIEDLRFRLRGSMYSFAEMMNQNLISRGIYVYRNGKYEQADAIQPYESFLLKYYGNNAMQASVNFTPYYDGTSIQPITPHWTLNVIAAQDGLDADGLIIGSNSLCSDNYDFVFDLPEPPIKPMSQRIRFFVNRIGVQDSLFLDRQLNSEFKAPLVGTTQDEKTWIIRLDLSSANPVQFTIDSDMIPQSYSAVFEFNDGFYKAVNCSELPYQFQYIPTAIGNRTGTLKIRNFPTGNSDFLQPLVSKLNIYPNPFNPETRITFSLGRDEKVHLEIYNIKGQKVRTLCHDFLKQGSHQYIWNGTDDRNNAVGSGVYFVKLVAGKKTQTKKIMLIK